MDGSRNFNFRQMLVKVGSLIKPDELSSLKFYCKDFIPTRVREKISTTEALFEALEDRGELSETNLVLLKSMLRDALNKRTDVIQVVETFEQVGACSPDVDSARWPGQLVTEFRRETEFLENSLGREYKSFLRRLGVEDHVIERTEIENHRNTREQIHQCILIWLQQNRELQHTELLTAVITALKKEKRNDLAAKIEARRY